VLIAVPLGVGFALALDRWRGRAPGAANFIMLFSFITPEVAIGVALFLFFVQLASGIGTGFTAQVLGLSMYMLAYPVIIVRARLLSVGKGVRGGRDGPRGLTHAGSPTGAAAVAVPGHLRQRGHRFRPVHRQLRDLPAAVEGRLDATIPILIYSAARRGPLPSLNALASLTLLASTALIVVAAVVYRRFTRAERRSLARCRHRAPTFGRVHALNATRDNARPQMSLSPKVSLGASARYLPERSGTRTR
jgi:spermidine/putrescine transport system permease protein